jgi:prepilin-type N-terminal cleavage/methylation domain-containing protein
MNSSHRFRSRRGRAGVTLPELMIVMVMFSIILAAIFVLYLQSLRTWQRTNAEATAEECAAWAVEQMSWDLRLAMRVDDAGTTRLVVTLPLQDSEHRNVITVVDGIPRLSNGDQIMFYLSNDTGSMDAQGDCLWKAVKPAGATYFTPRKKIAEGINPALNPVDPDTGQPTAMFVYWPDMLHSRGVQMTVTTVFKGGPHTYQRTETAEAYLRNPV